MLAMEYKIIKNSVLRVLTDKVDKMEKKKGNVTRKMESLRKH